MTNCHTEQFPDGSAADLIAEAQRRGYQLACHCLASPKSVAAMRGPVCRARTKAASA